MARIHVPRCILLIVVWIGLTFLTPSAETKARSLGFTVLSAEGIDPYDAKIYSQLLRKGIDQAGVYSTLEFTEIRMRLAEQNLPDNCTDVTSAVIAGQILDVDFFGFGTVGKIGKTYTISMQVIDVRSGRIIKDVSKFHKGGRSGFEKEAIPLFAYELSGREMKKKR